MWSEKRRICDEKRNPKSEIRTKLMGTECKEWLIEEWRKFSRLKSCFDGCTMRFDQGNGVLKWLKPTQVKSDGSWFRDFKPRHNPRQGLFWIIIDVIRVGWPVGWTHGENPVSVLKFYKRLFSIGFWDSRFFSTLGPFLHHHRRFLTGEKDDIKGR